MPRTIVSLTFDDGDASQAQVGPMLAAHGMNGTFYVNGDLVGTSGHMAWGQLAALAAGGNEIGGHTMDHVDLATIANDQTQLKWQICEDRGRLVKHGFMVTDFAYPYGSGFNVSAVRSMVKQCGYNSARRSWGLADATCGPTQGCPYSELIPPKDIWGVRTADSIQVDTTLSTIEGYVTKAESNGGWIPLVFHDICDGCDQYSTTAATLQAFLDWLQPRAANGTVVETVQQVIGGAAQASPGTADSTPPISSILCDGSACSASSYTAPVHVSLSGNDSGGSGLEAIRYTTDGTDPTLTSPVYSAPFTVSQTTTVKYRAWDNAGNVEPTNTKLIQVGATDTQPPTSSISCNGGVCSTIPYPAPVQVSLTATDDPSGVAAIRYTTDGTDPTLTSPVYSAPFTVSQTTTVKYRAWDNAGNVEPTNTQLIQVAATDTQPPTSSIACNGGVCSTGWYAVPVQVSLTATDDASGVAAIRYTTDGTDPAPTSPTYSAPFTLSQTTTVKYRAWDNAGNVEPANTQLIQIDTAAPTVSIAYPHAGDTISGTVQIQANAADVGSGVRQVTFYIDGAAAGTATGSPYKIPWNTRKSSKGNHSIWAVALDQAGNTTSSAQVTVTVK